MLPAERHRRIRRALTQQRVVPTEEFARAMEVSPETIRRDFIVLEEQGALVRVHGGATGPPPCSGAEATFRERVDTARTAKEAIGRAAAGLVRPGQTVVIDIGTTALEVARALPEGFHGTVATCSLLAAVELAGRPGVEVLVSGGRLRAGDLACSNDHATGFFTGLYPDVAFLGSGGVAEDAGLTDFHLDEVALRRAVLANAAASYVLADTGKFGCAAPYRVCGFRDFSGLITNSPPPDGIQTAVERAGGVTIVG